MYRWAFIIAVMFIIIGTGGGIYAINVSGSGSRAAEWLMWGPWIMGLAVIFISALKSRRRQRRLGHTP